MVSLPKQSSNQMLVAKKLPQRRSTEEIPSGPQTTTWNQSSGKSEIKWLTFSRARGREKTDITTW